MPLDIAALADRLASSDVAAPLTSDERETIAAALRQLAAESVALSHARRLLAIHDRGDARLDAILAQSLGDITIRAGMPAASSNYDFAAAQDARDALARDVESATTAREIIAAALRFARDVAPAL